MTESRTIGSDSARVDGVRAPGAPTASAASAGPSSPTERAASAEQPIVCPHCHGVIVGARAADLTPARGRLIVANGYCRGDCSPEAR